MVFPFFSPQPTYTKQTISTPFGEDIVIEIRDGPIELQEVQIDRPIPKYLRKLIEKTPRRTVAHGKLMEFAWALNEVPNNFDSKTGTYCLL